MLTVRKLTFFEMYIYVICDKIINAHYVNCVKNINIQYQNE